LKIVPLLCLLERPFLDKEYQAEPIFFILKSILEKNTSTTAVDIFL